MSLKQKYSKLSELGKNLVILSCIAVVGLLALTAFFFTGMPSLPLGWLIGSVISIVCYITIAKGSEWMLDPNGLNRKHGLLAPLFMILRFALYAAGLIFAAFCTYGYKDIKLDDICNLWTLFAAYLPVYVVLLFATLIRLKKPLEGKKEEKKDE